MTVEFNKVREANQGVELSREELRSRLADAEVSEKQIQALINDGVIQKAGRDRYRFLSTPLLWVQLERILNSVRERKTVVMSDALTVESAIELLKREGYKILRPRTEYDEI